MEDFKDLGISRASGGYRRPTTTDFSVWCAFGSGMIAAMAAMYLAVVRPIASEMERMEVRIGEIDRSIRSVAGQKTSAKNANDVLAILTEQGRRTAAASDALEGIRDLHERLARETDQIERALAAVENLSVLKAGLLDQAPQLEEASAALHGMQDIQVRLLSDQMVVLEHVDSLSYETVRRTLKKTNSSRG